MSKELSHFRNGKPGFCWKFCFVGMGLGLAQPIWAGLGRPKSALGRKILAKTHLWGNGFGFGPAQGPTSLGWAGPAQISLGPENVGPNPSLNTIVKVRFWKLFFKYDPHYNKSFQKSTMVCTICCSEKKLYSYRNMMLCKICHRFFLNGNTSQSWVLFKCKDDGHNGCTTSMNK